MFARRLAHRIAFAVPLLVAGAVAAQETQDAPISAPQPPSISVVAAATRELVAELTVTGTLVSRETVSVGADVEGLRIEELLADEGDVVEGGAVLARLATDMIEIELSRNASQVARSDAAIAQAESQIAEAVSAVTEADAALARTRALSEKGIVGQDVLDQRISAASAAAARLSNARQGFAVAQADKALVLAEGRELELRKAKTEIRAPAGGVVLARSARLGAIVSSAAGSMFEIARDGLVELDAEVSETVLGALAEGQPVTITLPGGGEAVKGTIRLVSPKVDETTRLGHVRVALEPSEALRPGTFARAVVETGRSRGVVVPRTAIVMAGDRASVQVVRDGVVENRPVTLGIASGGEIEVRSGLAEGESVVALAGTFVRDGDAVTPVAFRSAEVKG